MSERPESMPPDNAQTMDAMMRLRDPLRRMRLERRIALLFFNVLLLAAALMQLLSWGMQSSKTSELPEPTPTFMEKAE